MVTVFINPSSANMIIALGVIIAKFGFANVTVINLALLDESDIDDEITAITAASQDGVFVLATPVTPYAAAGDITEAQVVDLADLLIATNVAPYDAVIVDSDAGASSAPLTIWNTIFTDVSAPLLVRLVGKSTFPVLAIATANINDTTITKAGVFAGANYVGKYAAIPGYLVTSIIASHTDNALTVASTGIIDASENARIVDNVETAFADLAIPAAGYAMDIVNTDVKSLQQWMRMIDLGVVDPALANSASQSKTGYTFQDSQLLKDMIDLGNKVLMYNMNTA